MRRFSAGRGLIVIMVPVVVPLMASRVFLAPWSNQPNGSLERLESHLSASGAQGEVEPFALPGALQRNREVGLDIAAEGTNCDTSLLSLGGGQRQVSIM